jgi:uroporphyrinogen decarboxylase
VPCDVYLGRISPGLADALCRELGLRVGDHDGLVQALGAHVRWGHPLYVGPALEVVPGFTPEFPNRAVVRGIWGTVDGVETYTDAIPRPFGCDDSVADIDRHAWPDPDWFDYDRIGWHRDEPGDFLTIADWAVRHRDAGRWLVDWMPLFSRVMDLFGMEEGLLCIGSRPDLVDAVVAHVGDFLEAYYTRLATAAEGHADVLGFADDFAGQAGLLMSPAAWRRQFLPVWRRLFPIAHAHGMRAGMHACGAVGAVLGDLIDAGLDVLEPVQTTAVGMDPAVLTRDFGADLTFYGGVDSQRVLPQGSPEDVRVEVHRLVDTLGSGGRYVLSSCHFLLEDVPARNVLAMFDEARIYVGSSGAATAGAPA